MGRAIGAWCRTRVVGALTYHYTSKNCVIFRKNSQNRQFSGQFARLGKVKITSRAASDLKIYHGLLLWPNRGKITADCAKTDYT